jgi:hypothetical protein
MSIPQPLEKLDPKALASGRSPEVEQAAPNAMRHDQEVPSEHDFNWAEPLRIAFVALAAAAVWFRVWEPFSPDQCDRHPGRFDWRIPDIQRSVRKHR